MIARDRRRKWGIVAAAVAAVGTIGSGSAPGQAPTPSDGRISARPSGKAKAAAGAATTAPKDEPVPETKVFRIPVNPTDAVALVNGKPITRQKLADEAITRKGEEVLDALISRELIDQAVAARKIVITAQEIDAEVDKVVNSIGGGVDRDTWFRKLQHERKISPAQYKNDIIYPGIALRKLSENRVQVTEKDMKDAFEAYYGDKLSCRIIMCMNERDAVSLWGELKKNPGGFAHLAANDRRSIDESTKSNGGMLERPMTRHAYPRNVSDAAFAQLVDGDPEDKDPAHKPKDGDISGPMQVTPETWILIKREGWQPPIQHDPKDVNEQTRLKGLIFEAKLKEAMTEVFEELVDSSAVENRLTGSVKVAHEGNHPDHQVDKNVKLMSDPGSATPPRIATNTPQSKAANSAVKPEDRAVRGSFGKKAPAPAPAPAAAPK